MKKVYKIPTLPKTHEKATTQLNEHFIAYLIVASETVLIVAVR